MADDLFVVSSKYIMMATEKFEKNDQKGNKDTAIKPDAETLNTTDPQEHMEGPFSSLVKGAEDKFEKDGGKKNNDN